MRISDWSSDVVLFRSAGQRRVPAAAEAGAQRTRDGAAGLDAIPGRRSRDPRGADPRLRLRLQAPVDVEHVPEDLQPAQRRSEEHTSELQSLMRISYAVFCLKKKKNTTT